MEKMERAMIPPEVGREVEMLRVWRRRVLFGRPFYWMQLNESNGFSRLMILVSGF
jgi:hypothetical protein